jgi:subtilisin family serine protease
LINEPTSDELSLKSADGKKNYIVVLKDAELETELAAVKGYEAKQGKAKSAAEKIMKRAGITDGELGFVYGSAIKGFSVKIAPGQLKKLQDDPSVSYIEEDQIVTLVLPEVKIKGKPSPPTPVQTIPWGITRVNGGNSTSSGRAWVIDTGIDLDHPDLNVDKNMSKTYIARATTADDDNGHGSHCAGIIAARYNTIGVVGVAPGALLIAVKVLDRRGSGAIFGSYFGC